MTDNLPARRAALAAGIASLAGPVGAALYETGHLRFFGFDPIADVWLLVVVAAAGIGIGVLAIWKGRKLAGIICLLTNTPVLALYGFIGSFFALGGNR